jgi:hypothetical protein
MSDQKQTARKKYSGEENPSKKRDIRSNRRKKSMKFKSSILNERCCLLH